MKKKDFLGIVLIGSFAVMIPVGIGKLGITFLEKGIEQWLWATTVASKIVTMWYVCLSILMLLWSSLIILVTVWACLDALLDVRKNMHEV